MTRQLQDHNFKNLFLDFPRETLNWFLPQAEENWGQVRKIEFVREEPKKYKLSDSGFALDMPVLFFFKNKQLLLWLVEFQEDKAGTENMGPVGMERLRQKIRRRLAGTHPRATDRPHHLLFLKAECPDP